MLIESKSYIPQVYSKERQMQVFTKLIDIILTCCKYDIDSLGNVYNAQLCPEQLLPLLATTLNYKYNFSDTVTSNRNIIDIFAVMEKYRGSELGLKIAAALSLTSLNTSLNNNELITSNMDYIQALQQLEVEYDYENARIVIKYPHTYSCVRYLMDYVRPIGMYVKLISVVEEEIDGDALLVYATTEADVHQYDPNVESHVEKSFVNFSSTADNTWIENYGTDFLNMNNGGSVL